MPPPLPPHACAADALLANKSNKQLLQPFDRRCANAVDFMVAVRPGLQVDVGALCDPKVRQGAQRTCSARGEGGHGRWCASAAMVGVRPWLQVATGALRDPTEREEQGQPSGWGVWIARQVARKQQEAAALCLRECSHSAPMLKHPGGHAHMSRRPCTGQHFEQAHMQAMAVFA